MFVLRNLTAVTECSPHVPFVWKTVGIVIKVYIENNGKKNGSCCMILWVCGCVLSAATCAAGGSLSKSLSWIHQQERRRRLSRQNGK